jgi:hypothetical protein
MCNAFGAEIDVVDGALVAERAAASAPTQLSVDELNQLVGVWCSNALGMSASSGTCGLFPVMAMVNHSCDPSLEFIARDGGRYVRAFSRREVAQGEELSMSYLGETSHGR